MNKSDNELMQEYDITCKTKTIYSYKDYTYENLSDALQYARTDLNRCQKTMPDKNNTDSSKQHGG